MQRQRGARRHPEAQGPEKTRGARGLQLLRQAASSTVVIMTLITVLVLVLVANVNFGKGKPPAGAADISTNDLMQTLSGVKMNPVIARAQANASERAYEQQLAAERRAEKAAKKSKAAAKALAKAKAERRAWEALKKRMSNNPTAQENQQVARRMSALKGWGGCWDSLLTMWNHESGWNEHANNPGSGAYGIPQALPGSKMASAGADWRNNAMTQITWGLSYVGARYGDPCRAWSFWQAHHWY